MDTYQEYAKRRREEEERRMGKIGNVILAISTTIGILMLVVGIIGYVANTEILLELDDFYGVIGLLGGATLVIGDTVGLLVKYG